jgi:hypothetical protein
MKFNKLIIISAFLLSFVSTLTAQDWRWTADHTLLAPHVDPDVGWIPGDGPTAFYDIDNDGLAELIVPSGESFKIIEQTGEFPDIIWRISDENCFEDLSAWEDIWCESFILQDLDQDNFPEIIIYSLLLCMRDEYPEIRVYHNRGDYNNPDWIRNDELLTDIIGEIEDEEFVIPVFCDWDSDGHTDLMIATWDGFQHYEQNDNGNWEELESIEGLYLGEVENRFADFNGDSVLDLVSTGFNMQCRMESVVYLNIGSIEEPEMSEPYSLDDFRMLRPFPFDINGDGRIDLTNGRRYMLNTGEEELDNMWDRPIYWGIGLNSTSVLYDFDDDETLDFVRGVDLSYYDGGHWVFEQYQLTDAGWKDTPFFGDDLDEHTYEYWPEYRALKVVEMFEEGNPCMLKVTYSEQDEPRHRLTLLEDADESEGWNWRPVANFFDDVIDASMIYQTPSFGDMNGDGVQDIAMLSGLHPDSLRIVFYQLQLIHGYPSWELREDWGEGLGDVLFRTVSFADLDGDGDSDMIGMYLSEESQALAILFQNIGDRNNPEWSHVQDAFNESGPETETVIQTADVNGDGLPDILTTNLCFINETQSSVQSDVLTPVLFNLYSYPNPFNSTATIKYSLPIPTYVSLGIYDLTGKKVIELAPMDRKRAGLHTVVWNGSGSPSGLYWIVLDATDHKTMQSILLLK